MVLEDLQVAELAQLSELPGEATGVPLEVLVGEDGHPAVSTVISPLTPRLPLRCQVTGEVSQPGGAGAELKEDVSSDQPTQQTYLG